jgi:hypothetical protein
MSISRSLTDIANSIEMLDIRCSRCDRIGRVRVDKLIDQYGGAMLLPDLGTMLVADCDNAQAHDYAKCDVFYPQLSEMMDDYTG